MLIHTVEDKTLLQVPKGIQPTDRPDKTSMQLWTVTYIKDNVPHVLAFFHEQDADKCFARYSNQFTNCYKNLAEVYSTY